MTKLSLIVGLGNPGQQYAKTRHNAGFWFVKALADHHAISFRHEKKYHADIGRGEINGSNVWLMLPQTYMNKSGQSVAPFVNFFNLSLSSILIAHDELDFPPGKIQLKSGGGHGGHNGLRDIVPHIGKDFHRLRIGIGHPGHKSLVSSHVLSQASAADQANIDQSLNAAITLAPKLVAGELDIVKNKLNGFKTV